LTTSLKDPVEAALWRPYSPNLDRYKSAAEKARHERTQQIPNEVAELHRLRQRHEAQASVPAVRPQSRPPPVPNAAKLVESFGANAMVEAHLNIHGKQEDVAAQLDKARILTAAANAGSGQYARELGIAARAQRLDAAQHRVQQNIRRDVQLAQTHLDDEERRKKYLEALAQEHARRSAHGNLVRDLLLESYTHQYTDYEPIYTGKAADPYFLEPYPADIPLIAEGNVPELNIGQSGVPHGHAFQAPNQAKYDHETDQFTSEVKPFYEKGSPFEHKDIAGELTIDGSTSNSSSS